MKDILVAALVVVGCSTALKSSAPTTTEKPDCDCSEETKEPSVALTQCQYELEQAKDVPPPRPKSRVVRVFVPAPAKSCVVDPPVIRPIKTIKTKDGLLIPESEVARSAANEIAYRGYVDRVQKCESAKKSEP